jgi:hypothetical protein
LSQAGKLVIGSDPYFTDRAKQLAALAATPQVLFEEGISPKGNINPTRVV